MAIKNPLGLGFKITDLFFDRKAIAKDIDPRKRRFLSKFGSFVRTRARSALNKPGGKNNVSSEPGQPPRKQTGLLRKGVFFAYDKPNETVVIGPIVLSSPESSGLAPEALEEGGYIVAREISMLQGRDSLGRFTKKQKRLGKKVRRKIQPRPYMLPAFEAENARISEIWRQV